MGINNTKKLKTMRELVFGGTPSGVKPNKSLAELIKQRNRGYRPAQTGNMYANMDDKASYGDSDYDDMLMSQSELEQYGSVNRMRALRQPWSHQVANGLARFVPNVVMSTIGQTAAALDIEDYHNVNNEVGNWLTSAMNAGKEGLNEALPIYRENPGEPLDLSDSGWWFENGFSLAESITSFVATGGIIAKTLTTLSRAAKAQKMMSAIMGSNAAQATGNATNTVINAIMLNQSEAILEATDVYEDVYQFQMQKHGDDAKAKQKAADAAAATVSFNRLNIPLNLTSANLFFRAPQATRRLLKNPYSRASMGRAALEGGQESMEEIINMLAAKKGMAVGTDAEYGLAEMIDDITSPEGVEAALLGFLGGMGQTALTVEVANRIRKTTDPETGKKMSVRDYNIKEYENFKAEIEKLDEIAKQNDIGDFTSVFKSTADIQKITQAIKTADEIGEHEKAADLRKLLLANQAYTAFQRGTTEHLINLYEALGKGPQKDGMEKDYKSRASEAVTYIRKMEKVYNETRQYENAEKVYYNRAQAYTAGQQYLEAKRDLAAANSDLAAVSERMMESKRLKQEDLGDDFLTKKSHPEKAHADLAELIKSTPEYKAKERIEKGLKEITDELEKLDKEHAKITTDDYQEKAKKQREKAQRQLKKMIELMSDEVEKKAEVKEKTEKKEAVLSEQEKQAEAAKQAEEAQKEQVEKEEKKAEHMAVGDIVNITEAMSKKFAGKEGTVVKTKDGRVTIKENESGHTFSFGKGTTKKKKEPEPVEIEEDFGTEGGEDHVPLTAEEVAKNDPALDPESPQPEDGGAKVVSSLDKTGEYLDFIKEQYPMLIQYERAPISKKNKPVTFEINTNTEGLKQKHKTALALYEAGDFSEEAILHMIDYLPINVVFRKENGEKPKINGPLETLPYSNANGAQDHFNEYTRYLRANIVNALSKGVKPEEIVGSIQDQYKGVLQLDNTPRGIDVPENAVHDLDFFGGDMDKVELFMVNKEGNLVDTKGKVVKHGFRGRGEIYTVIPQANGEPFYLKLNVKRINKEEAEILYELYRQRMMDEETKIRTVLGDLPKDLQDRIYKAFGPTEAQLAIPRKDRPYLTPLELIGKRIKDITIKDITDFLIYDGSTSYKSKVRLKGAKLEFGRQSAFGSRVELEANKRDFIKFLMEKKRHHIKYRVKANDPTGTRIHAANRAYVNYLLGSRILNTNAIVGAPTFQGRTQIYLNLEVNTPAETIGTPHDPNKARPIKENKYKGSAEDVDNAPKKPINEEAQLRQQWVDAVKPYLDRYNQIMDEIEAGTANETAQTRADALARQIDLIDEDYITQLQDKGYDAEIPTPTEGKKELPTVTAGTPEAEDTNLINVYKDEASNWTLEVKEDGTVVNANNGKVITNKKLINKAHLKSGFIQFQKVDLGNGKVYAYTSDGRIINIGKKEDGTPSPSNGNEIKLESSTAKKVLEIVNKPEEKPQPPAGLPERKIDPRVQSAINNIGDDVFSDGYITVVENGEGKKTTLVGSTKLELIKKIYEHFGIKKPKEIRNTGEKIVPLHEVPGTPEHEAKQNAEREESKEEKPVPPKQTKEEIEQQEKPEEQCGPPTPKKLTAAEKKRREQRRRGKK